MYRYEILFLTVPEITKDESDSIKNHFTKVVRNHKANLLSFDRWGKYHLAYPVNNNEYGVYFLTRLEVDKENKEKMLESIKDIFVFKFNTLISKSIVQRLDPKASLEYKRPDSLEDNPQDVDMFLKRNDMEGLIKKPSTRKGFDNKEHFDGQDDISDFNDGDDLKLENIDRVVKSNIENKENLNHDKKD